MAAQQPTEDSTDETLISSERSGDCTPAPLSGAAPEIPSAVCMVEWHSPARATGERKTLSLDLKLPAPIPIQLLKIPIALAATSPCRQLL
jgi:hypothetical protein